MVNSVRDSLDRTDTISEISLLLGAKKDAVCVVVEGDDDERVFAPLLNNNVIIFQSYSGKTGLEDIVNHFKLNTRVIGIRDRDYLENSPSSRVFLSDYCCLEIMIVSIKSCFDRLLSQFYRGEENHEKLKNNCFSHLERYSKLRKLNEQKCLNICFKGVKITKAYDDDYDTMDKNLFDEVKCQNPSIDASCYYFLLDEDRDMPYDSLLYITNGHDFVSLFYSLCCRYHKKVSLDLIKTALFSSFGETEFKRTKLCSSLMDYQEKHSVNIIVGDL